MRPQKAIYILLLILSALSLFHLLLLLKVVTPELIWGGRLSTDNELYLFEGISLVVTFYLILILLIRGSFIRPLLSPKVVNTSLWVFLILFILNTIGNLLAKTTNEKVFALLTLTITVLIWMILKKQKSKKVKQ